MRLPTLTRHQAPRAASSRTRHRAAAVTASKSHDKWPVTSRQGKAFYLGQYMATATNCPTQRRRVWESDAELSRLCSVPLSSHRPTPRHTTFRSPPPSLLGRLSSQGSLEILVELPRVPSGASRGISSPRSYCSAPQVLVAGVPEDQSKANAQQRTGTELGRLASIYHPTKCGFTWQMPAPGKRLAGAGEEGRLRWEVAAYTLPAPGHHGSKVTAGKHVNSCSSWMLGKLVTNFPGNE